MRGGGRVRPKILPQGGGAALTLERIFYDFFKSTHGRVTPADLAGWTKGQLLVIAAQGRMSVHSSREEGRVFGNLRDAYEYKRAMRAKA